MATDDKFEPKLGRIRSSGVGRGKTYLQRVLKAAAFAGAGGGGANRGFVGSRTARGFGAGRVLARRDRYSPFRSRRVVVKTRIVKLRGQGAKAAALHLRYIQRDGVTVEGAPGELYDRKHDRAEGGDFLKRAEGDRHQFRFIVSAEDASEYPDLKPFVRKLMTRMETDLGTSLDWVAVDHHNTGHPHTHIVLRGKDDLGQDLVIAKDYIAHGMRARAAEILSLDLGPRTDLEIEDRFARQVSQERLTDLDRALRRAASLEGNVEIGTNPAAVGHPHWAGRLQALARFGLAEEEQPGRWRLSPQLENTLRAMGERADIIKTMNRELTARSVDRGVTDYAVYSGEAGSVTGRVVARGLNDAQPGTHYLILDGTDGRAHYAVVPEDADGAIMPGAIARLGSAPAPIREVDQTVEAIARGNQGIYSAQAHQAFDQKARPEFIESHVRRLEAMRRLGKLVERRPNGDWEIAPGHAERGRQFDVTGAGGRAKLLSPVGLEEMRSARAGTWLDQELSAGTPTRRTDAGFGHEVGEALKQRRAWLVEQGLARAAGERTMYPAELLTKLRAMEVMAAGEKLAGSLGKSYAAPDGRVDGVYRGPLQLVSGKFAIIEKSREFTLVPWRPVLDRQIGKPVSGLARSETVTWSVGRQKGPSL